MRFFIILSGDELTEGRQQDANGAWLARALCSRGFVAGGMAVVGDDREELSRVMEQALSAHDAVVVSGGLGGTPDDLTRFSLSDALGRPLEVNEEAMGALEAFWARLQRTFPSDQPLEAMMPVGASMVPNGAGLAPGIFAELNGSRIVCLPGVPTELRQMVADGALDLLGNPGGARVTAVLRVIGMREPVIAEVLGEIMERGRNPLCGIAAKQGEVMLTLRASGKDDADAQALIDADLQKIRDLLGDKLYAADGRTLPEMVVDRIKRAGRTLAVAESLTGGLIGHVLTEIPGVSEVFLAGYVTYANEAKCVSLGVSKDSLTAHGAVSEQVAREMAEGALRVSGADYAVATTGIAGPSGGTAEKPVGTCWTAAASADLVRTEKKIHGGSREEVKRRSVTQALDLLRRLLDEEQIA